MKSTTKQPTATIRYGTLKGTVWKNRNKEGVPYYSVTYCVSYTDDNGLWKETSSLSEFDNLKLETIRRQVADRIVELRAADRCDASGEALNN